MNPLLEVQNLDKSFGDKKILKRLNLSLNAGDILGLVGKSGCGKSTLLKILVGYYSADSGKILYKNKDITKNFSAIKSAVGYTTQENSFYDKLTVYENMIYYAKLFNTKAKNLKQHIYDILHSVQLFDARDKLAETISGGMKRRLDFAISIVHNPEIIILDEPTTGLDPILVDQFWKIVLDIAKQGDKAIIISSHLLDEIQRYCNRVAIMKDGKIETVIESRAKGFDLDKIFRELNK
jgi:ABC-2 type transport system ATP-binding protein